MFEPFLFWLRERGLKVSTREWLDLQEALSRGLSLPNLGAFYSVSRALLVKREGDYDRFDAAFVSFFQGIEGTLAVDDQRLEEWLSQPVPPRFSPEQLAAMESWDLDRLRKELEERLKEQTKRHDGGSRWVGTGGTSPFGHGGANPAGIRIGGQGGGRSAVQVAENRRFRDLRKDRVLDTRSIGQALRRLRRLRREGAPSELNLDASVDETARMGGEIELVFEPSRDNQVKLLLLVDVGGSMDPHAEACEQLFSAAHKAHYFKQFDAYTFHNCPYERLYTDISRWEGVPTQELLRRVDSSWTLMIVGDAWMSPFELTHQGGAIYYGHHNARPGILWLRELRRRIPRSVWLNPEPERIWGAESVVMVRHLFPMFPLTLKGLEDAISMLRGQAPNRPTYDGQGWLDQLASTLQT